MASKPKRSESSLLLEQRQLKEVEKLESQTAQRKLASARRTRGRASLISGSEEGIGGDPLFGQKNLATKERLGREEIIRAEDERKAALAAAGPMGKLLHAKSVGKGQIIKRLIE